MKWCPLLILSLSVALVGCGEDMSLQNPLPGEESALLGGAPVTEESVFSKSVVQLAVVKSKGEFKSGCTGTLIAPGTVLTAAHCVKATHVVFEREIFRGARAAKIREFIAHPFSYGGQGGAYDAAVVHFDVRLQPKEFIPYELPEEVDEATSKRSGYKSLMVVGAGISKLPKDGFGVLRSLPLEVRRETDTHLYFAQDNHGGSIFGDSGGPAFVLDAGPAGNEKPVLWAIGSYVLEDDGVYSTSVYLKIQPLLPWIRPLLPLSK